LLLGLSVFFVGSSFLMSFLQFGTFVLFLFFAGGIYGLIYSLVLFLREYTLCSKKFIVYFRKYHGLYFSLLGFGLLLLSSWISFFLLFGVMCILIPILFSFAHALEESVMKRKIKGVEVRLGDWLVNDVKVGKKKVIACFEGVTEEDLKLLKKVDSVEVKDGLPFAPAFLIGFVLYYFYGNSLLQFLMRLFSLLF
jgi:prepilin signal peptidase PulO-like enzyme (type II secretory pathway)